MARMHNPPHPGEILREFFPKGMTVVASDNYLDRSTTTILTG
jgi:plasmid maintenance system antidote protein VapI